MVLIFDLDDTLYDELTFVRSGLRAVAAWGADRLGWDAVASYLQLIEIFEREGRGRIFNQWLRGRAPAREAIRVYRHHFPSIALWPAATAILQQVRCHPLYLVTDGHKVVQANKVRALGLQDVFRHAYLTNRYGRDAAKPSLRCFDLIRRRERCAWADLVYVGDNPAKDFVSLNALGGCTIRVLTGQHRDTAAAPSYEARHRIDDLAALPSVLRNAFP